MVNIHEGKEIWALYENVVSQIEAMQIANVYTEPEYSILNGQKAILLEVIRITF